MTIYRELNPPNSPFWIALEQEPGKEPKVRYGLNCYGQSYASSPNIPGITMPTSADLMNIKRLQAMIKEMPKEIPESAPYVLIMACLTRRARLFGPSTTIVIKGQLKDQIGLAFHQVSNGLLGPIDYHLSLSPDFLNIAVATALHETGFRHEIGNGMEDHAAQHHAGPMRFTRYQPDARPA